MLEAFSGNLVRLGIGWAAAGLVRSEFNKLSIVAETRIWKLSCSHGFCKNPLALTCTNLASRAFWKTWLTECHDLQASSKYEAGALFKGRKVSAWKHCAREVFPPLACAQHFDLSGSLSPLWTAGSWRLPCVLQTQGRSETPLLIKIVFAGSWETLTCRFLEPPLQSF